MKKLSTMLFLFASFVLLSASVAAQAVTVGCVPSFGPVQTQSFAPGGTFSAFVDFNNDGKLDLIAVDSNGVPSTRFGTADGFSEPVVSSFVAGIYQPTAIAMGYFDGDYIDGQFVVNPNPDIAVATAAGGVYLLTSDPYGYFCFRGTPVLQGNYAALAAVDFNEDGMSDIMAVDVMGGSVLQFSQPDGNWGSFAYTPTTAAAYANGETPVAATLGYFDGVVTEGTLFTNDLPDLAVLTSQGRVLLYTTDPDGFFTVRETNFSSAYAEAKAADLNQDGRSDLLAKDAAGTVYLILRKENGDFDAPQAVSNDAVATLLGAHDLNGDGALDIAVTLGNGGNLAWFGGTAGSCKVAL